MQSQNRYDPNYLLQINAFHRFTESQFLPPNARLLWFSLIDLCNTCGWPEWVQVNANRLLHWIGAKDIKTAYRARDELVMAGLLEYEKGCRGRPNRYRLLYFPVKDDCSEPATVYRTQDGTQNGTQDGTQDGIQNGIQDGTRNGTQYGLNDGHINKQEINKTKQKEREYLVGRADAQPRCRTEYAEIVHLFNTVCTSLPQVQIVSARRKCHLPATTGGCEPPLQSRRKRYQKAPFGPMWASALTNGSLIKPRTPFEMGTDEARPQCAQRNSCPKAIHAQSGAIHFGICPRQIPLCRKKHGCAQMLLLRQPCCL